MQERTTAPTWVELAEQAGIRLEALAVATGKSYSAVYRYKTGTRKAPDEWLEAVAAFLRERVA